MVQILYYFINNAFKHFLIALFVFMKATVYNANTEILRTLKHLLFFLTFIIQVL